ncbi:hypothetical protein BBK36DRAFT_1175390 [Trichoderma citrinoviride]|uniref:Uncharacterized protein n=1 Tax=Trichoderma citrinoviride TaxID=58853 RepID=A0A2T4BN61_9HYPO|nr:hypothetical protein BBK36DRAFT_1175390 [Trichoderma citrinoviride]PTB70753.1 hypothetical protein BBK36DRAFT_1175390 [Trichoderma citrinoviride]
MSTATLILRGGQSFLMMEIQGPRWVPYFFARQPIACQTLQDRLGLDIIVSSSNLCTTQHVSLDQRDRGQAAKHHTSTWTTASDESDEPGSNGAKRLAMPNELAGAFPSTMRAHEISLHAPHPPYEPTGTEDHLGAVLGLEPSGSSFAAVRGHAWNSSFPLYRPGMTLQTGMSHSMLRVLITSSREASPIFDISDIER